MLPKISILMPNYNHSQFLAKAIEGVICQTYPNWELVVVDDGSTDNSRAVIERYATNDSRISPIFLVENKGVVAACQIGMSRLNGSLLFAAAADDYISDHHFFEIAVNALQRSPRSAGVFGRCTVVNGDTGERLWQMGSFNADASLSVDSSDNLQHQLDDQPLGVCIVQPRTALEGFLSNKLFIPGASAIWKLELVESLGGYDELLGPQVDFFLNHALAALHGAIFIDRSVTTVRFFANSYSGSASAEDYIRRHALVERKIRQLNLDYTIDDHFFIEWRKGVLNARLAESFQRRLFKAVDEVLVGLQPWEIGSFDPELSMIVTKLRSDCSHLERKLDESKERLQLLFDEVVESAHPKVQR